MCNGCSSEILESIPSTSSWLERYLHPPSDIRTELRPKKPRSGSNSAAVASIESTNWELSHKKKTPTFHYTGCLIGIFLRVYYYPHITGQYNPLYNPTNQGFFRGSREHQEYSINLKISRILHQLEMFNLQEKIQSENLLLMLDISKSLLNQPTGGYRGFTQK